MKFLTVILLGTVLLITLLQKRFHICLTSGIWLLYCFNILLSVTISGFSFSAWGNAILMVEIVLFTMTCSYTELNFNKIFRLLVIIAAFHTFFVLLQLAAEESFQSLYFPILPTGAKENAMRYSRLGYNFGLLYSPHEVAGILSFSIAGLLLWRVIERKGKVKNYFLVIILSVTLFLVGKKGVLGLAVLSFIICVLILYGSRKQWHRAIFTVAAAYLMFQMAKYYIMTHPDNTVFYRMYQFFDNLNKGKAVDSGRNILYAIAVSEWNSHKLFGIGWYHFVSKTVTDYGYNSWHQVNLDYLQWLCETGIIGLILNLIPLVTTLYQAVFISRKVIRREDNEQEKWMIIFAVFIQLFTAAYAFIEVPFYDIYFFSMYMISCMIINGVYADRKKYKNW
ncbi:O-antigen ligase family protein [Clostridium sp. AM58-1XD]|uniref:O-antigen ligase family protein n=1 Tax=Clostridium sp. AM58-1XD TaxID=2292307 RepID=UPI0011C19299|nr:O-antigen ligase family protein [Clostridium sp. AM58-1XD]